MPITSEDVIPLSRVRASFTALAEEARSGHEKLITRNGESYVAVIDARRLDYYHRLEREHIHLNLLEEAQKGLEDLRAGRVMSVQSLKRKHGRS
ncbi:MAG: prevent-host-death protein [Gammaproteobacteria bacterium]